MLRQFTVFFLLSVSTFVAHAEDEIRYYNVEVVLFEHTNPAGHLAENWMPPKQTDNGEQAELIHQLGQPYVMEAESLYDPQLMFTPVQEEEYQLVEEAKKVEESNSRRVLMHTAWRQPGLSREQAIRVHFKQLIENKDISDPKTGISQTGLTLSPASEITNTPYLEGSIKVMLARYLHVDTDILYYTTAPAAEVPGQDGETVVTEYMEDSNQLAVYHMKQLRRRIRSTELHYLDHPVLGMLLKITPYEKPEVLENSTQTQ